MRKRRIYYVGALALALVLAIPSVAMASGTQNVRAYHKPQKTTFGDPSTAFPFTPTASTSANKKKGTFGVEVSISNIQGDAPSAQTADIHLPEELKLTNKGLDEVAPAELTGLAPSQLGPFEDSKIGQGGARALGLGAQGPVNAYNGTKVNGNPSIILHSFAANVPIVLVGELRPSPLGSPYGLVLHVPVSTAVGGGVPPGIVIDLFNTTISKSYKDKKILKKAKKAKKKGNKKKAKKLKKKAKKNYATVPDCGDGTLTTQAQFTYANAPPQAPVTTQPCS